jgi:hypothetical protein
MSRIPSHVRLLKDRWSYRLEVSAETLKAFNGRLDERVLRADAACRLDERVLRADAACRLREFADCTESVSLPPGVIVAEPEEDCLRIVVDPGREAATQEAVLLNYDEIPIGVVAVANGHASAPLDGAKHVGIDAVTGLPAYMAP